LAEQLAPEAGSLERVPTPACKNIPFQSLNYKTDAILPKGVVATLFVARGPNKDEARTGWWWRRTPRFAFNQQDPPRRAKSPEKRIHSKGQGLKYFSALKARPFLFQFLLHGPPG